MPKLKTGSSAGKRFKQTAKGKVLRAHACKRHGTIKRTSRQIRDNRGVMPMDGAVSKRMRKLSLPCGE